MDVNLASEGEESPGSIVVFLSREEAGQLAMWCRCAFVHLDDRAMNKDDRQEAEGAKEFAARIQFELVEDLEESKEEPPKTQGHPSPGTAPMPKVSSSQAQKWIEMGRVLERRRQEKEEEGRGGKGSV